MPTTLRKPRLFTVSEYHAMVRAGVLDENDRVELIRGQIIPMAAIGSRHASCVNHLTELFILRVRPYAIVHIQNPIRLSRHSEPEPDLALLERKAVYAARHPGPDEVLLVVEVADTTLDFDRRIKIPLYAEAGLREFWIVNLVDECLEVYRQPGPGGYAEATTLQRGDEVQVQALPEAGALSVDEILGP
jgi:Uma2 family endonuclease